jgi:hypothetical protein
MEVQEDLFELDELDEVSPIQFEVRPRTTPGHLVCLWVDCVWLCLCSSFAFDIQKHRVSCKFVVIITLFCVTVFVYIAMHQAHPRQCWLS